MCAAVRITLYPASLGVRTCFHLPSMMTERKRPRDDTNVSPGETSPTAEEMERDTTHGRKWSYREGKSVRLRSFWIDTKCSRLFLMRCMCVCVCVCVCVCMCVYVCICEQHLNCTPSVCDNGLLELGLPLSLWAHPISPFRASQQ